MAYNRGYNPDALPPHAEPEQAAAMLSGQHPSSQAPPRSSSYANKPPPPAPVQSLRPQYDDRYANRPPANSYSSNPSSYNTTYTDGRQPSPRYDTNYNAAPSQFSTRYAQSAQQHNYSQAPPPPRASYGSPPPPAHYGQGPPPQSHHNRPALPTSSRPPPTPAPPRDSNNRDTMWQYFCAVDKDRSGALSEAELSRALVNGDFSAFDPHTVRMMIRMFDTDRSGSISFDEFCGLWGFLAAWRALFDRFDADRSGVIEFREFEEALVAFGYRLSGGFVRLLFATYEREGGRGLSFDLFVQACISLKRMTDVFKKYDDDRDGYITLSFEEFLTGAQSLFLFNSISANTDTGLY
ncbi:hypothetical protein BJ546DRAFT_836598 [Cryomyces antarcticus]